MMKRSFFAILFLLANSPNIFCWNNGLAKTPPMGWLSWMRFACEIDCKNYPDDCINEQLYKNMIDRIVEDGYLEAGYNYVNIDDCWMSWDRDPKTLRLVANSTRFPSGIKSLAEYAHSKNVRLGIYEDVGTMTCEQYPGTFYKNIDHTFIDAKTFSDWKIDSLKLDGCYAETNSFSKRYPEYRKALSQVERKILYTCSWPAYLKNITDDIFQMIRDNCNTWRNFDDIVDSYKSVWSIIKHYGDHNEEFIKFNGTIKNMLNQVIRSIFFVTGPNGWFDPDMLIIGNNGLSYEQSKTQMAFWCMWSAPLIMSNDLRTIRPEFKEILLNRELIAINQDPLGIMARRVFVDALYHHEVWVKKLSPIKKNLPNAYAVLYFNGDTLGVDKFMSFKLSSIIPELNKTMSYLVYDLFKNNTHLETLKPNQQLKLRVPISGSVRIVKLVPQIL